jgi:hypothetical protein
MFSAAASFSARKEGFPLLNDIRSTKTIQFSIVASLREPRYTEH